MLVGITAGLCHAGNAVFMKMTIESLTGPGVLATAVDWPGYALAASTASGLLLGQLAFATGALPPAVASTSVTNPVASLAVGLLAFGTPAPTEPAVLAAIAGAATLIALGIVGLANSSSTQSFYGGRESRRRAEESDRADASADDRAGDGAEDEADSSAI